MFPDECEEKNGVSFVHIFESESGLVSGDASIKGSLTVLKSAAYIYFNLISFGATVRRALHRAIVTSSFQILIHVRIDIINAITGQAFWKQHCLELLKNQIRRVAFLTEFIMYMRNENIRWT
ncbi:hypothetical protein GWI33_005478 [Rhynchophorus ferrugineus]|uniref:Uncharacterized protein n=1 Tax=Rhynchophorus ferrugineus TaxID=354439 RepID=A0A834IJ93_RHYFE|nr:hypothetical protein GWI33_005478 [Rhynchophorus ferrugineus]